jgi:hypothetical protein
LIEDYVLADQDGKGVSSEEFINEVSIDEILKIRKQYGIAHFQTHTVATTAAGGHHATFSMERSQNTKCISDAVAKPSLASGFRDERRRRREWVCHQDLATGLKDKHVCVVHATEGRSNIVHRNSEMLCQRRH